MSLVPAAILERVLLLALSVDVACVVPEPNHALPLEEMQTLALVCREWRAHMERLYQRLTRLSVDVMVARHLDIEIVRLKIKKVGHWTCDWAAVIKALPNLRRLDLSQVCIRSRHIIPLLEAASTQCSRVEALMLTHVDWTRDGNADDWEDDSDMEDDEMDSDGDSVQYSDFEDDSDEDESGLIMSLGGGNPLGHARLSRGHELDPAYNAQYAALERWYRTSANAGLRQLEIVERRTVDRIQDNNVLLRTLAAFALRLNISTDQADPKEHRCTETGAATLMHGSSFAAAAPPSALKSLFSALPALEELSFKCQGEPSAEFSSLSTLLTDDLVATLVSSCPRLRHLEWRIMCGALDGDIESTQFTDASLARLATLPSFEKLDVPLAATACTEQGLLAFARGNGLPTTARRTLNLELDPLGERGCVRAFIGRLLEEETDVFGRGHLQMMLKTRVDMGQEEENRLSPWLAARQVSAIFMCWAA